MTEEKKNRKNSLVDTEGMKRNLQEWKEIAETLGSGVQSLTEGVSHTSGIIGDWFKENSPTKNVKRIGEQLRADTHKSGTPKFLKETFGTDSALLGETGGRSGTDGRSETDTKVESRVKDSTLLPFFGPEPKPPGYVEPETTESAPQEETPPEKSDEVLSKEFKLYEDRINSAYSRVTKDVKQLNALAQELDSKFTQDLAKANETYRNASGNLESRKLYETLIQGAAHIIAGVVGMNSGLDLSGLKFDKNNWDAEASRLQTQLESDKRDAINTMDESRRKLATKRANAVQDFEITSTMAANAKNAAVEKYKLEYQREKDAKLAAAKIKSAREKLEQKKPQLSQLGLKAYDTMKARISEYDDLMVKYSKDQETELAEALAKKAAEINVWARNPELRLIGDDDWLYPEKITDYTKPVFFGMFTSLKDIKDIPSPKVVPGVGKIPSQQQLSAQDQAKVAAFARQTKITPAAATAILIKRGEITRGE